MDGEDLDAAAGWGDEDAELGAEDLEELCGAAVLADLEIVGAGQVGLVDERAVEVGFQGTAELSDGSGGGGDAGGGDAGAIFFPGR